MTTKQYLMMGLVAVVAIALVSRIPQIKAIVFGA
jgi:hypothetical protein